MALIALDIGGTKLLVAAADETGKIVRSESAATPRACAEGLELLRGMVRQVANGDRIEAIGAACGGPIDAANGVVSPLHQPDWREVPLKKIFEDEFGCPFRVEVDTDAAALAEYRFGGAAVSRLLYLTISTGMGGGLLVDGAIYRGHHGLHPEAGHQAVPYAVASRPGLDLVCACGARGCLEALVSGNGIRALYGKAPEQLDAEEWREVGRHLGFGLRNLAILYAPERIVLGGGVATGGAAHFLSIAEATMAEGLRLMPPPEVCVSALGYHTALLGAVALAQDAQRAGKTRVD